jgi:outer membrane protein assembly factor BamB
MTRRAIVFGLVSGALGSLATGDTPTSDWPQWGGPRRDFSVAVPKLAAWPDGGPRRMWERPLGEGFSAISVAGGALYTMYRRDGQEHVVSMDAADGRTRWDHAYDAPFSNDYSMENGEGPHAAPLVAGARVFAVGSTGLLHALDGATGRVVWRHDLIGELGGFIRVNGYASSPIAFESLVILPVGGRAGLMAFDQATGKVVWRTEPDRISPASLLLIDVAGRIEIVAFLYDRVASFDPHDGRLNWSHPHSTDFGLNVSMPVWSAANRLLVVSSAYNGGTRALALDGGNTPASVRERWFTNRLRVHFGTTLLVDDLVIGSSGDFGPGPLTALDVRSGEVVWRNRSVGRGSGIRAGNQLLWLTEDGQLVLGTASHTGFAIEATATVTDGTAWTVPTLVGSRMYVRDRRSIRAFALGE